jgi:hypothetical protein
MVRCPHPLLLANFGAFVILSYTSHGKKGFWLSSTYTVRIH